MILKMLCDGRGARSRVSDMGGNKSKLPSNHSAKAPSNPRNKPPVKSEPSRPTISTSVPVWPKNSARWHKLYDVYICSSEQDISYSKALLSYLQEQPENLRCFLPMRDMNPGGAIPTEMTDGAENSHCWVLLLTSNSLSDQWCHYQMHQFLTMAPIGNGRLIPVLVELPFRYYPKELRYMYSFNDAQGDQRVFKKLRDAIVSYLTKLPTVTPDQEPGATTNRSPSSSLPGINSQITNSQPLESTSDTSVTQMSTVSTSLKSSIAHESTNITSMRGDKNQEVIKDTSLESCIAHESTKITSVRGDKNQEDMRDTSLESSITHKSTKITSVRGDKNQEDMRDTSLESSIAQEASSNTSESTRNNSTRCSITQMTTSKKSVIQETISEAPLKQASANNTSEKGSLDQESTKNTSATMSITQGSMSNMPMTSPVTQVSTCDTFIRSPMTKESSSETYLRSWSPKTNVDLSSRNYETLVSSTKLLPINCKTMDSNTPTRISAKQEYARKVDSGSCNEQSINMDCQSFEIDIYTSSTRTMTMNKNSNSLQSNKYTSCGRAQVNKVLESFQGDIYTSCSGNNADLKVTLDLQRDIYTSSKTKEEVKPFQSLQSNIYTSCGRAKTQNEDSESHPSGRSQAGLRDTLSLLSNIYTSSGRSKDVQSIQEGKYTSCAETEAKKGDSKMLLGNFYASDGGMQTQNDHLPSYQSDLNLSFDGKQPHVDLERLQTEMYTSSKGNEKEKNTSCSFESHLCTSYSETQPELKSAQNLRGEVDARCDGLQASNKFSESLQSDIYTSSEGIVRKNLSCTMAHTMDQTLPALQSNLWPGCTDIQAESKDSDNSSCIGAKTLGSDLCAYHGNTHKQTAGPKLFTHRDESSRAASEAADKT